MGPVGECRPGQGSPTVGPGRMSGEGEGGPGTPPMGRTRAHLCRASRALMPSLNPRGLGFQGLGPELSISVSLAS